MSMHEPHEHDDAARAPGASAPGEPGYEGEVTLGEDAMEGTTDQYESPFGRPEELPEDPEQVPPEIRGAVESVDRLLDDR